MSADIIVKVISEIEEGFIDGINDVLIFFKANITSLLIAATPPQQVAMAKSMVVPSLMKFVEKCWNDSQRSLTESANPAPAQPAAQPKPAPVVQTQPEEEKKEEETGPSINQILATAKSATERKQMLLARYREQV